jgi:hypothetical protein
MIQAFLPALHELEYAVMVEVCFSILHPCAHGLLECLIVFKVLAPHMISQGPKHMAVQSLDCRVDDKALHSQTFQIS